MKWEKRTILTTSAVILLPMVLGLLLWNKLPTTVPIHFNTAGEADGYAGKAILVFLMPLLLLAVQFFALFCTARDPKNGTQSTKVLGLIPWIVPVLSLVLAVILYPSALGRSMDVNTILFGLDGLLFLGFGNYLPKCRPNYTVGIRLPWTLDNEENWTRTHRMAGPVWVAGGILMLMVALLPLPDLWKWMTFTLVLLLLVLIPTVYSHRLHRQGL